MNYDEPHRPPLSDTVIALLSEDEIKRVNRLERAGRLSDADEYLDLEQLDQGVRRGPGPPRPICRMLPRKAVRESTWAHILARLNGEGSLGPWAPQGAARTIDAGTDGSYS